MLFDDVDGKAFDIFKIRVHDMAAPMPLIPRIQMQLQEAAGMAALDVDFKHWRKISEQMTAQITSSLKMEMAAQQSLDSIITAQKTAFESISLARNFSANLTTTVDVSKFALPAFEIPDLSFLTTELVDFRKYLQSQASFCFDHFGEIFRDLSPRTQKIILGLAACGWYPDIEMTLPQIGELAEALLDGNSKEAEDALIDYFESHLDRIEDSITRSVPPRAHLIRAALRAHRERKYELSIPVLLAQTDGICKDVTDRSLFRTEQKRPATAVHVDKIRPGTFKAALLSPLAQTLPINASEHQRASGSNALNRHAVLHGESLGYGSKTNSLKAISLVNYVTYVLVGEAES